jgi:hypothetical protein
MIGLAKCRQLHINRDRSRTGDSAGIAQGKCDRCAAGEGVHCRATLNLAAREHCIDPQFLVRGKGRPNGETYFIVLSDAPSGCQQQKTTKLHDPFHFPTSPVTS